VKRDLDLMQLHEVFGVFLGGCLGDWRAKEERGCYHRDQRSKHTSLPLLLSGVFPAARSYHVDGVGQSRMRMRHGGCGGLAAKAELLTGIEGVSNRPVRRIVLR
jgi:hypothetical protein